MFNFYSLQRTASIYSIIKERMEALPLEFESSLCSVFCPPNLVNTAPMSDTSVHGISEVDLAEIERISGSSDINVTQLMGLGKPVISAPKKGTGKKSAGQLSSSPGPVKMRLSLSGIRGRFPHRAVHLHTKVAEVVYQGGFAYGSSLYCFLVPRTLVSR
jgi:hypothetical protein